MRTLGLVRRLRTAWLASDSSSRRRLSRHCRRKASSSDSSRPWTLRASSSVSLSLREPLAAVALAMPRMLRRADLARSIHLLRRAVWKARASAMTPLTPVAHPLSKEAGGSLSSDEAVGARMAASIRALR